jgi:hypothetical protein
MAAVLGLLLVIANPIARIRAEGDGPISGPLLATATTHYVSPGASCGGQLPCYATPQAAVDAATDGDTIKIASGTYTTAAFEVIRVFSKSLQLLGGYSPANWDVSDPLGNKTILDPQNVRGVRGIVAQGFQSSTITITVKGFTVINGVNSPPQSCGGICTIWANVDISNNYLYSNTASSIQVAASTGSVSYNLVQDTKTDPFPPNGNAGIAIESSVINLISNTVQRNGAGIRSFGGSGLPTVSYIESNLIQNNSVGILSEHADGLEVRNSVLRSNVRAIRARDHIIPFTYPTTLTITNNLILSNTNTALDFFHVMLGHVTSNQILNNKLGVSHQAGDGSTITFTLNSFDKNENGGIYINAAVGATLFNIFTNTVTNNGTSGISVQGGEFSRYVINSNWIDGNKPESTIDSTSGAGLFIGGETEAVVSSNRFSRNVTNRYGGGIFIDGSDKRPAPVVTMTANVILTNTAQETGSGFAMSGGIVTATNDIVSRNYQERPAVYIFLDDAVTSVLFANHWTIGNNGSNGIRAFFGGKVRITNSIVAGHKIFAMAESIGGDLTAENILSFNNPQGICDVAATCTNIIEGDPKFLSDALLNFHIKADSAAIDKATTSTVTDDIDGPGRPIGPAADLGADEFGNAVIVIYEVFLPKVLRQTTE